MALRMLLIGCVAALVGGCAASLQDFKGMTSYERENYVCREHRDFKKFEGEINALSAQVSRTEIAIARGYHVHKTCREVTIPAPPCASCYLRPAATKKRVCRETAVDIDGDLEERKLRDYRKTLPLLRQRRHEIWSRCQSVVKGMAAEEIFDYYQQTR